MGIIRAILLTAAASIAISYVNKLIAQQSQTDAFMNREYFDTTCSPCKDFYQFANGSWLKKVVFPPDQNTVSSLDIVQKRNQIIIREILDSLAYAPQRHARNEDEKKLGIAYCNCMDSTIKGSESLKYIQSELNRINKIKSQKDLSAAIGRYRADGISSLFWFVVVPDDFNPTSVIAEIRNLSGWRLPQLSNYLSNDSTSIKIRRDYLLMLKSVFMTLGDENSVAEANAGRVLDLETTLVRTLPFTGPPVNNKISVKELQLLAPSFKWNDFLKAIGQPDLSSINIRPPVLLTKIDSLVANIPIDNWKAYLLWQYIGSSFLYLQGDPFERVIENFFLPLWGMQQMPPRYTLCFHLVNNNFADALGHAFVERSFSSKAKGKATELGETIIGELRETLSSLEWLTTETRKKALVKLDSTKMQIGYPDEWPNEHFPGIRISREPFIGTYLTIKKFSSGLELAKIEKPVAVSWFDAPTFPGANYYSLSNTISFTASYLQPPFFDPEGSDIANYAAVGVTFGHEITHGFDTEGRLYNEFGLRKEWWTPEEIKEYNRRAELVVKQYDEYIIIDTIHQNGRSTLKENIADIGGLRLAYLAFMKTQIGQSKKLINGFTPEQWFFIAFAQSTFRSEVRPEIAATFSNSTHSFHKLRVNGPLSNISEFASAFGCKQGDTMVKPPSELGQIWK